MLRKKLKYGNTHMQLRAIFVRCLEHGQHHQALIGSALTAREMLGGELRRTDKLSE